MVVVQINHQAKQTDTPNTQCYPPEPLAQVRPNDPSSPALLQRTLKFSSYYYYYDIIIGRDFLQKIQFNINFDNNTMNCMDMLVPMRPPDYFSDRTCLRDLMFIDDVEVDSFASTITKSTYQQISISTIVDAQTHLTVEYRNKLSIMLNKHTMLFDGILKVYPHQLIH